MTNCKIREIIDRTIARSGLLGRFGYPHIYNDRLKDGSRSVKVWGRDINEHTIYAKALRRAGYSVTIKKLGPLPSFLSNSHPGLGARLHIKK